MPHEEVNKAGFPAWDSAAAPDEGRNVLKVICSIFMPVMKTSHPELVAYFRYRGNFHIPQYYCCGFIFIFEPF